MDLMMRFGMVLVAIMIEPSLQTKIPVLHNYEMAEICELPCNSYTGRYWTVAKKCFPCQEGTRLVCMDNKKFCAPYEVCEAGTMKRVVYDNKTDTISLVKDECPHKYYQPVPEECLDSCQIPHSYIPDHVIIHKEQTSTSPAEGYCDFLNGWISLHEGWTFFNLSQPFDCYPAIEYTYFCNPNEIIFNNRSCSTPCSLGNFHVDKDNYFRCKFTGNHSSSDDNPAFNTTENSDNGEVSTKGNENTEDPKSKSSDTSLIIVMIAVFVIIVLGIITLACLLKLHCKSDNPGGASPKTEITKKYIECTVINSNGNDMKCTINTTAKKSSDSESDDETSALSDC